MNALRQLVEWDTAVRERMMAVHQPVVDAVMIGLTTIGRGGAIWIVIALTLLFRDRTRLRAVVVVLGALLLAFMATDLVVKPIVGRARPFQTSVATRVIDRRPLTYSFPSGHAASSVAGAITLSWIWPQGRLVLWALAALVGLSRIYVGVHYPLDVLGGAVLGLMCAWPLKWFRTADPRNRQDRGR
jgi:undecaprenyl-diphosphatase